MGPFLVYCTLLDDVRWVRPSDWSADFVDSLGDLCNPHIDSFFRYSNLIVRSISMWQNKINLNAQQELLRLVNLFWSFGDDICSL